MKKLLATILASFMLVGAAAGCSAPNKNESSGTSQEPAKQPALNEIHEAVKDAYGENYFPNQTMEGEMLSELTGLNMENVQEVIAETPMISINPDIFIAVKAKEGKGDEVKAELEKHKDYLINESLQYPMNMAKVGATKVIQHGDYVFLLTLGGIFEGENEEEAAQFAEDQVKIGVDTINGFFK